VKELLRYKGGSFYYGMHYTIKEKSCIIHTVVNESYSFCQ